MPDTQRSALESLRKMREKLAKKIKKAEECAARA
jgi:hypothetical protein